MALSRLIIFAPNKYCVSGAHKRGMTHHPSSALLATINSIYLIVCTSMLLYGDIHCFFATLHHQPALTVRQALTSMSLYGDIH